MKLNNRLGYVIGVTGGIGAGKSSLTKILQDLGAYIIDADKISKNIYNNKELCREIKKEFGEEVFDNGAQVNRKKLAQIVFNDNLKLVKLNAMTHKMIGNEIVKIHDEFINKEPEKLIVLDVPIPVEYGFLDLVDEVWVVIAGLEVRIERIRKRDNITREEILKRINSQLSEREYLVLANKVFFNNGSIKDLQKKVGKELDKLLKYNSRNN